LPALHGQGGVYPKSASTVWMGVGL
jgi:hypothetical protein